MEPPEKYVCQKVTVYGKLPWWILRRGAKLRGPKKHHRDGNHPTREAKALVSPQDEVTSSLRQKQTETYAWRCVHAQDWCNVPKRNDQPRERRPRPTTLRVAGASAVCAVPCSVVFAVRCASSPQQRTLSSVPFTRPPMNAPHRLKHDEIKKRGSADATMTPLSVLEFRTVQRVLTGILQPRPSTDMVMLPSSVRTTPTAVGRLSCGIPVFTNELLQFEATTIARTHHPGSCMTIRIRGLPALFGFSKPIAGGMTTAFAGTPLFTAASQSRTVGPSTAPRTTLSVQAADNHKPVITPALWHKGPAPLPRQGRPAPQEGPNLRVCWAVRTRSCVKEKCSFKSKWMVNPVMIRRCVIEEL